MNPSVETIPSTAVDDEAAEDAPMFRTNMIGHVRKANFENTACLMPLGSTPRILTDDFRNGVACCLPSTHPDAFVGFSSAAFVRSFGAI